MACRTRFSVNPLSTMTRQRAAVVSLRADPDVVIKAARVLPIYSERLMATTGGDLTAAIRMTEKRHGLVPRMQIQPLCDVA